MKSSGDFILAAIFIVVALGLWVVLFEAIH
jgi:hypothetical protein